MVFNLRINNKTGDKTDNARVVTPELGTINKSDFQLLQNHIESISGISITMHKMYLLQSRLSPIMAEYKCLTYFELYKIAVTDKTNKINNRIIDAITTNETLWFRDKTPFLILKDIILKKMALEIVSGKRKKIRIWSAGCSTGQEPYSIAITILEYIKKNNIIQPDQVEIFANDISSRVIEIAKKGVYSSLEIDRGLPSEIKKQYFSFDGKNWEIHPKVKKLVCFFQKDIRASLNYVSMQDIIFCRNTLIYFSTLKKMDVFNAFAKILRPNGYLFLGGAESILDATDIFTMKMFKNKGLYYKNNFFRRFKQPPIL